jgi:hypothetical protein
VIKKSCSNCQQYILQTAWWPASQATAVGITGNKIVMIFFIKNYLGVKSGSQKEL